MDQYPVSFYSVWFFWNSLLVYQIPYTGKFSLRLRNVLDYLNHNMHYAFLMCSVPRWGKHFYLWLEASWSQIIPCETALHKDQGRPCIKAVGSWSSKGLKRLALLKRWTMSWNIKNDTVWKCIWTWEVKWSWQPWLFYHFNSILPLLFNFNKFVHNKMSFS